MLCCLQASPQISTVRGLVRSKPLGTAVSSRSIKIQTLSSWPWREWQCCLTGEGDVVPKQITWNGEFQPGHMFQILPPLWKFLKHLKEMIHALTEPEISWIKFRTWGGRAVSNSIFCLMCENNFFPIIYQWSEYWNLSVLIQKSHLILPI